MPDTPITQAAPPPLDVARVDAQWRAEQLAEFETRTGSKMAPDLVETTLALLWLSACMRAAGVSQPWRWNMFRVMKLRCEGGGLPPWDAAADIARSLSLPGVADAPA